jgi:DNA polymerase elongation subunit (family B)
MRDVLDHECSLSDMIFETRVSQGCDDYRQFNDRQAAMRQYRQQGIEIQPGQCVRYIITDHRSKSYSKRVMIPELADKNTAYDSAKYCEHLLRAAESILLPFGYTQKRLDGIMKGNVQGSLCRYA